MMQLPAEELRQFVQKYRREQWPILWAIADIAPFGGYVIGPKDNPYLLRIYLTPSREDLLAWGVPQWLLGLLGKDPWRVYLHFFFRGDADRELHNHPTERAVSLILTCGYTEERWDPNMEKVFSRIVRPLTLNFLRKKDFHRVLLTRPEDGCWTLFCSKGRDERGPEDPRDDWGFLNPQTLEYTPWGQYVDNKAST